jgi:pentatricopeptide repeat protein
MSEYPSFVGLARKFFDHLLNTGVEVDVAAYTSLINICARANDLHSALLVWRLMKERKVQPDARVFSSILAACASKGNMAQAEELLVEMRQFGVEPNVYIYSALVDVYAKGKDIRRAFATLDEMVPLPLPIPSGHFLTTRTIDEADTDAISRCTVPAIIR